MIIILCPIRNEDWILKAFLCACSKFADHILIADQNSVDGSAGICRDFPKVTRFVNGAQEYNEAERIEILIQEARERFGQGNVLLALDADEVPVNTRNSDRQWQNIRELMPGVSLRFSKPDIDADRSTLVDMGPIWRLGYVDDGADHEAGKIHAQRVPCPEAAVTFDATDIAFLHVNLVRPMALRAKRRMYCALENAGGISSLRRRLLAYNRFVKFSKNGVRRPIPQEWIGALAEDGLDLDAISEAPPFWQDFEVLRLFKEHGSKRFWLDDLWDADWYEIERASRKDGSDVDLATLRPPPQVVRFASLLLLVMYRSGSRAKKTLKFARGLVGKT